MHIYYATRGLRGRPYHSDMRSHFIILEKI